MRARPSLVLLLPLAALLAGCKPGPERLVGTWNGSIQIPALAAAKVPGLGGGLPITFTFKKEGANVTGALVSPKQTNASIPMDTVTYKDGAVELAVNKIGGKFTGKLSEDGKQLAGTWSQGPVNLPLTLKK